MNYTADQLVEIYEKLPTDIQQAIADANTEIKIAAIGERHGLHVDQIGELANETGLMMLGLKHPGQFISSIMSKLGLSQLEAETIAQEINTEVLASIRETIKLMTEKPATPPSTPASDIFEQKVSKIFSLSADKPSDAAKKAWEADPYLERP